MEFKQAIAVLKPQWESGLWAKSSGEFLWAHQYKVWRIAVTLLEYLPSKAFTKDERSLLELACLTHDIGKMRPRCQARLKSGHAPGDHKLERPELADYFRSINLNIADDKLQMIWDIARTHHSFSNKDFALQEFENAAKVGRMLMTADWLASMSEPNFATVARIQEFYENRIGLTTFQISRFPSPMSSISVEIACEKYGELGWQPLLVFLNAAIFIAQPTTAMPNRRAITDAVESAVLDGSLALQKPVPNGYTGDFLTLLSKQYPERLLSTNEARIKQELSSINRPLVFLKLARDILEIRYNLKPDDKEASPLLSIVDSANSTAAHPKAKQKYREAYGEPVPPKVNNEMIAPLFERSTLQDVIPSVVAESAGLDIPQNTKLQTATTDQLFAVLEKIAVPQLKEVETPVDDSADIKRSELAGYLDASISMEEEADFAGIAQRIFDRYKSYKRTSDAEKGACERCACPVVAKMQPALNFATAPQAFSQIKPKYQYRAVCPLCGYDNLVVRSGVYKGSWVFARVESELPDLLQNCPKLDALIQRICSALRQPRSKARMQELPGFESVPFPNRLRIPIGPEQDMSDEDAVENAASKIVRLSDRGLLLKVGFTKGSEGPKDLRAQYEPVFHVLQFLGFKVAIGTEDQDGLFGKPIETTDERYMRSLAVVFLATQVDKTNNRLVYASELLERSPATALTYAAGDGREKFGLNTSLLETFIEYIVFENQYVSSRNGEMTMRQLLEHAAFLSPSYIDAGELVVAPNVDEEEPEIEGEESLDESSPDQRKRKRFGGMWTYCENKSDGKMTKHSATKPISQALDQLMLGRGVDFALNTFMRNLNQRIKNENTPQLTEFVAGVRKILDEAEKLRLTNVTDFLRYKNGLLSAVFMLTRYPDLKSVAVPE